MVTSLRWQIAWPPLLALCAGALLVLAELDHGRRSAARHSAIAAMWERLDRTTASLAERHGRAVRRAREALIDPRPSNGLAILAWTSEHYLGEIERFVDGATRAMRAVSVPGADSRLEHDLTRLEKQLEGVLTQAQQVAAALSALRNAVSLADERAVDVARAALNRTDRALHTTLRICGDMLRRTSAWQARQAAAATRPVPPWAWVALAGLAAMAPVWSSRCAVRLARLAQDDDVTPASAEERAIAARLSSLIEQRAALQGRADATSRGLDRAQKHSLRMEREQLLLRLYNDNLMDSLRAAVVVTDANAVVTAINRAARSLLGLTDESVDASMESLALQGAVLSRGDRSQAELSDALTNRRVLRFEGVPYPHPSREVLLDVTVAPSLDESGNARGAIWLAEDVTEQVHTKAQLLAAERLAAVGRLSAQVAHEIRNPLSAIALNTELLEEELSTPELSRHSEARQLLSAISSEIERLTEVTEGYLQLARMPGPSVREVALNPIVEELFTMLREEMKAHGVKVELQLERDLRPVMADPGQLRQALLNIVRNAREAMQGGGRLAVRTQLSDGRLSLTVRDSGMGIDPALLPRIFEPFFSTKPDGTGLGLSLTEQIVEEHGGQIEAQSHPGEGTTFTIVLPAHGHNSTHDDDPND